MDLDGSTTATESEAEEPNTKFEEPENTDESDFWGDQTTEEDFQHRTKQYDVAQFWHNRQHHVQFQAARQKHVLAELEARDDHYARKRRCIEFKPEDSSTGLEDGHKNGQASNNHPEPFNPYEGDAAGKQLNESLSEFLHRLPASTTSIASVGPWIYVANPYCGRRPSDADVAGVKEAGGTLLRDYRRGRLRLEEQNPSKNVGSITRMMSSEKVQLEKDIIALAKKYNVTTGKWMLRPKPEHVDDVWSKIAKGTLEGKLGVAAKVATDAGNGDEIRLICAYTKDFSNREDIKRVLNSLRDLKLVGGKSDALQIYYKMDVYTHLDIMSGNEYRLKASMLSSKDL